MDISKYNKAEVLAALYNGSRPQGMGFIQFTPEPMTVEQAEKLLKQSPYFDYIQGRVMKLHFVGDDVRTDLYDRDLGPNHAENIISKLTPIK